MLQTSDRPVRSLRQMFREEAACGEVRPRPFRATRPTGLEPRQQSSSCAKDADTVQLVSSVLAFGSQYRAHYSTSDSDSPDEKRVNHGQQVLPLSIAALDRDFSADSNSLRAQHRLHESVAQSLRSFLSPPNSLETSPVDSEKGGDAGKGCTRLPLPHTSPNKTWSNATFSRNTAPIPSPSLKHSSPEGPSRHGDSCASSVTGASGNWLAVRKSKALRGAVPQSPSHFEYAVTTLGSKEDGALDNWQDIVQRKLAQTRS